MAGTAGLAATIGGYALPVGVYFVADRMQAKTSTKFLLTGFSLPFAYGLRVYGNYAKISSNLIWSYDKPKISRDGMNAVVTMPTRIKNQNKFGVEFTSIRGNIFIGRGKDRQDLGKVTIAGFKLEKEKTASFDVVLTMRFTQIADNVLQLLQNGVGMRNLYFDATYNFKSGISFSANIPLLT